MSMEWRGLRSTRQVLTAFLLLPYLVLGSPDRRDSTTTYPAPISVPPSQNWDGNDGPWSTFVVQVGTPPQTIKVLASTASYQNWVIAPEGCQSGELINCHTLRGELFQQNASTTWSPNLADPSSNIYELDFESALGYTGKGRYGFDDITFGYIGQGGVTLKNQTLAAIATKSFFMGLIGLTPRPSNFSNYNNPIPSFMQNLQSQSMIPSLSWAYTAGNQYRQTKVLASLTLGGYDESRFIPNNLSFPLSMDSGLPVQLQSITSNATSDLLPSPVVVYIDSTTPYLWLPAEACTLFEDAFGLTWNATAQLYLLNDTQHSALKEQNPSVTFKLGIEGLQTSVDITLPYSAFDLTATWPLATPSTPYFPLKRAANSTQYMLGRTFFQEAYIIADYERMNFSISQCNWTTSLVPSITAILPPSNTTTTPTPSPKSGLSTGAIAGIGAGGGVIALVAAVLIFIYLIKPRLKKKKAAELAANQQYEVLKPELDGTSLQPPVYETDGRKITIVPPTEIGDSGIHPVYEMSANEEVAIEMRDTSTTDEKGRYAAKFWKRSGEKKGW